MIVLTVKTLDSQNHSFTVDDDITVEQFKAKIAETVSIPADTQRIIYCGRVLQDAAKLAEYDVNGKVVHLVQRPPPSAQAPRATSPRRGFRGFDAANTMYLGSMAFPSGLMESQGIVPPPPTHSLAGSRLNVARRMLRRAEAMVGLLENPARPEQAEEAEEEVTPLIEARVIVPRANNDPFDDAVDEVLSAVQNTIFDAVSGNMPSGGVVTVETELTENNSSDSTPEEGATGGSSENSGNQREGGVSARSLAENASRTAEMAELLNTLNQLQVRFAPFLERYRQFMADDPIIPQENVRQTQTMLTRVSEVLHFLGHAYHSLSDIIIRVRTPPPRPLLCRPILIQHSAVVQAGIPIQVEAQFNLSDRPPTATTSQPNSTTTTTTTATSTGAPPPPTAPSTAGATAAPQAAAAANPMNFLRGFPFLGGGSMRVQSFPIEVRAGGRQINLSGRPAPNNNNNAAAADAPTTAAPASTTGSTPQGQPSTTTPSTSGNTFNLPNSNVEFFMDISPDDSMLGQQARFVQTIAQVAGEIMNEMRTLTGGAVLRPPTTAAAASSADAGAPPAPANGQNSQARVSSATHPTTATHTRSTPRPHVHLAQQAMQGGFDPFLPCNSHHVTHRRRSAGRAPPAPGQAQAQPQAAAAGGARGINLRNVLEEVWMLHERSGGQGAQAGGSGQAGGQPFSVQNSHLSTLAELFRQDDDEDEESRTPGNLISEFTIMLSRSLTLIDVIQINSANFTPLMRIRNDIRDFLLQHLVESPVGPETLAAGVERLVREMQQFFERFALLQVRDNVNIVRSIENLFKQRLPSIVSTIANMQTDEDLQHLIDDCISLFRTMFAISLHCSANGRQGVEDTFTVIITNYMRGFPDDITNWTIATSRITLRQFLESITVRPSEIERFIIRNDVMETENVSDQQNVPSQRCEVRRTTELEQPMELDEPVASSANSGSSVALNTSGSGEELLAGVVVGAEPWHAEVPTEWVPIISRDAQRQRRQPPGAPFSDAYLSGMPTKRRKIVNSAKPQGSLPQVIADSVRRAVTATGLAAAAPLEVVSAGAGDSGEIQTAYRGLLRTTVQSALRDNEDFTPERFPNASTYFKPQ